MKMRAILAIVVGVAAVVGALVWYFMVLRPQEDAVPPPQVTVPANPAPVPALTPPPPSKPPTAPSFDVVRVNPDGRAVIAGRAAPGSVVSVMDGDKVIGTVKADQRGEWVLLPDKPLASGARQLTLQAQLGDGAPVKSEQSVVLNVPEAQQGGPAQTLAVAVPEQGPKGAGSTVLQTPQNSAGLSRSGDLVLGSVDYDSSGNLRVNGRGPANGLVQVYLNNHLIGRTQADANGVWRMVPEDPVQPGNYTLRVDLIKQDGTVVSRLEVPFVRTPEGELLTSVVQIVPGNNLWRIAQRIYGEGIRYTVIYEANKQQIKDPNLIYPGQVFVLPKTN